MTVKNDCFFHFVSYARVEEIDRFWLKFFNKISNKLFLHWTWTVQAEP